MGFSWYSHETLVLLMVGSFIFKALMADPRTTVAGCLCNAELAVSGSVLDDDFTPSLVNLSTQVNIDGFEATIVGRGPNMVYGLSQCYGDLDSIDCQLCFGEVRSLLPKCHPRTGGRIFLDGCFARYENHSFFDQAVDSKDLKVCSSSKNNSEPEKFLQIVTDVVGNVSLKALNSQGFAVGSGFGSGSNLTVHALAQCWKSLNRTLCKSCLDNAASSIVSCSPAIEGRALNAGCYMRYSTRIFWNLNHTSSQSSWKRRSFWIILVSALGGLLLIAGVMIWKMRDHFAGNKKSHDLYSSRLPMKISQSKLNFRYRELRKATSNFDSSNKLGQGGYGSVYKGVLPDGRDVAIKRLFLNTRQWFDQFFNEVDLINRVRHKNLVKLLGCSVDGPESLLVYEYYFNKSLDQFIFDPNRAKNLDWQKRFNIIQGVAEGLSYLHHESEIRIIHRDIKASNILLDEKLKPKITDFGLARSFPDHQTHLSTSIAGTLGYMAPEYIVHGHLTEKVDVYSFGVLILEIVTSKRCGIGMGSQTGQSFLAKIWNNYKANTVEKVIDEHLCEASVREKVFHVVYVGLLCTQATPSLRPTMAKVVEMLRGNKVEDEEGEIFPTEPPFLDMESVYSKGEESRGSQLLLTSSNSVGPSHSSTTEGGKEGR